MPISLGQSGCQHIRGPPPGGSCTFPARRSAISARRKRPICCDGRRTCAVAGGGFLVGIDLQKHPRLIEAAYNDRQGVTAAFNRNILVRINRQLGADFDIDQFAHRAFYNVARHRIEMHLVSRREQTVHVGGMRFFFAEGESIHTENSYKFGLGTMAELAEAGGFAVERVWTDERQYFSVFYLTLSH